MWNAFGEYACSKVPSVGEVASHPATPARVSEAFKDTMPQLGPMGYSQVFSTPAPVAHGNVKTPVALPPDTKEGFCGCSATVTD
jgi:hypothetical protein